MPLPAAEIKTRIQTALPDAVVTLLDLAGDNDHWQVTVTSPAFTGLSRVKQHKMVYDALGSRYGYDATRAQRDYQGGMTQRSERLDSRRIAMTEEKELSAVLRHLKGTGELPDLPKVYEVAEVDASRPLEPTEITPATQAAQKRAQQKKQLEQENNLQLIREKKPEPA